MGRRKKEITGRIDIVVRDEDKNAFLFIECKAPEEYEAQKENIEGQLFNLAEEEIKQNKTKVKYLVYYTVDVVNDEIVDRAMIIDFEKYKTYNDWKEKGEPCLDEIPRNYGISKK